MTKETSLFIVATPIGNLSDITMRAIEILKSVDIIAAEDTRHSGKLLNYFDISTPMRAYHDHSGEAQTESLLALLEEGKQVALISDAGTPLISDPGYRLVSEARARGVKVVPIPGACALVAALCASGLPSDRFSFEGFPPAKENARKGLFESLAKEERTMIFYESPHRIQSCLSDMAEVFGESRNVVLAREITKTYETFLSGKFFDVMNLMATDANQLKGEMVVLVHGHRVDSQVDEVSVEGQKLMRLLMAELPLKKAAAITAQCCDDKKNALYQWGLDNK